MGRILRIWILIIPDFWDSQNIEFVLIYVQMQAQSYLSLSFYLNLEVQPWKISVYGMPTDYCNGGHLSVHGGKMEKQQVLPSTLNAELHSCLQEMGYPVKIGIDVCPIILHFLCAVDRIISW